MKFNIGKFFKILAVLVSGSVILLAGFTFVVTPLLNGWANYCHNISRNWGFFVFASPFIVVVVLIVSVVSAMEDKSDEQAK